MTRTKLIWQKAESLVCTRQVAAAICTCMFWLRGSTPNYPIHLGFREPRLTRVISPHKCTCQMASESVERFKQGARM